MSQRDWEGEWTEIMQRKGEAMERSQRFQAEVVACFRRRRPPPMQLLREADKVAAELAALKAREEDFLRDWRGAQLQA